MVQRLIPVLVLAVLVGGGMLIAGVFRRDSGATAPPIRNSASQAVSAPTAVPIPTATALPRPMARSRPASMAVGRGSIPRRSPCPT